MSSGAIKKIEGGRWEVRYRDPEGRSRRRRFDLKSDAENYLADVRIKGLTGTWIAPEVGRVTFAQWVDEWRETTVHLRSSTRLRYDRDLRLHVLPRFGRAQLAKITPRDVRAWISEMRNAGVPVSAIRRRYSVFRKIMGDATAMQMLIRTPCVGIELPQEEKLEIKVLPAGEVQELADAMPPWCRSWVYVAAYTGLRWSEMLGIRRRDIDLLRRTLTVHQQIIEVGSRFEGFGAPKTSAGRRTIDLPGFLCEMLEVHLSERAQPGPDGLVFVNTRGNSPHLASFSSQTWKRARAAIGRPDLRWHDLRHTAVALAIDAGAHPKVIQERMGHASITITMDRYGHLFDSAGTTLAAGLDEKFRTAATPGRAEITAIA